MYSANFSNDGDAKIAYEITLYAIERSDCICMRRISLAAHWVTANNSNSGVVVAVAANAVKNVN